jgi:hypothetical protein
MCVTSGVHLNLQEDSEGSLTDRFWAHLSSALSAAAQQAVAKGGAVRDILTNGFPQLSALLESTLDRAARDSEVPAVAPAVLPRHRSALSRAVAPFQEAFLSGSLARTREAINALYPAAARTPPTAAAVQQCIGCVPKRWRRVPRRCALCILNVATGARLPEPFLRPCQQRLIVGANTCEQQVVSVLLSTRCRRDVLRLQGPS